MKIVKFTVFFSVLFFFCLALMAQNKNFKVSKLPTKNLGLNTHCSDVDASLIIILSPLEGLTFGYNFQLSWSHYLKLIRIDDENERKFYEIEAIENNWSLRELKRQCDSALYQRLCNN